MDRSEYLRSIVGRTVPDVVVAVERGPVSCFAEAVLDGSPASRDPRAAEEAGWGRIPAPPTFPIALEHWGRFPDLQEDEPATGSPMAEILAPLLAEGGLLLHGEQEFDYHRPIAVGDVLVGRWRVVDAYQKASKGATMTFIVVETAWSERDSGQPVVVSRSTAIHRLPG